MKTVNGIEYEENGELLQRNEGGKTWYLDPKNGKEYMYRIRKLTPRECWRLMGVDDADFDKVNGHISNSQLYKLAGNSIVVDQLVFLFRQMFSPKREKELRQRNLFDL